MDFLFDQGPNQPKLHLPVKLSSRERVVQAWAHQRMLDAAYGDGAYKAILVLHSETKLDMTARRVTEITVPTQWLAYQTLLARIDRIYYFDMPARHVALAQSSPDFGLRHFADFFTERASVLPTHSA